MDFQGHTFRRLGHDSILLHTKAPDSTYVYFDPYELPQGQALPKADLILISHPHQDHCSIADIQKIIQQSTIIIAVPDALSKLSGLPVKDVILMEPGKETVAGGIAIKAVPAYNVSKFRSPGVPFHPKENDWVGYLMTIAGTTLYFAGDTDVIPEMGSFGTIDVAFLPVSGTYVMTAKEAVEAWGMLKPALAVPMHYGSIVGTKADAENFKSLVEAKGGRAWIID